MAQQDYEDKNVLAEKIYAVLNEAKIENLSLGNTTSSGEKLYLNLGRQCFVTEEGTVRGIPYHNSMVIIRDCQTIDYLESHKWMPINKHSKKFHNKEQLAEGFCHHHLQGLYDFLEQKVKYEKQVKGR
tara:strand:+ start:4110 stop:4493 length:384 start_codon:yes stop_codon:yes gene_type:complete